MSNTKTFLTTPQLIRTEIARLHERGGGDWKRLADQADAEYRSINYNTAQWLALHVPATVKELDLEWGRGTGKTTVFARFARAIAEDLPRGAFQWEVPTYQKFLTEIIPAFIHALEMQGLYKDLHYFIGRRPPARWKWPEPYKPPLKYDNFITFWTGFGINLLSQDIPGAGRGLSTDGRFADEACLLSKKKLDEDSGPSIRGSNAKEFKGRRFFDFRIMSSSTALTKEGAWFIDREEAAVMNPDRHRFSRANCLENVLLGYLKEDYLTEARRSCADLVTYEAEYLNIRPRFVRNGFYALLDSDRHAYTNFNYAHYGNQIGAGADCRGDEDLATRLPLILGLDWGAAINSMVVCQALDNPREIRALKNFFSLGADGETQDDMFARFHDYYQYHRTTDSAKEIWLWYDATGNAATGNTKLTRAQQAEAWLIARGWSVRRMSLTGTNPRHFAKYQLWERILQESDSRLPRFRINRQNCRELWVSMANARAKTGINGEIKKDKSGERADNPRRQYATDLSDAVDQPVFGMYNQLMRDFGVPLPV